MTPKKLELFKKLMMLTTSDIDGEALAALRKATSIIAADNLNWEEFISRGIKVTHETSKTERTASSQQEQKDTEAPKWVNRSDEIDKMFDTLFESIRPGDSFLEFVTSVYHYYKDNDGLTGRQHDAIRRAYYRRTSY